MKLLTLIQNYLNVLTTNMNTLCSIDDYSDAGIYCSAQAIGSLTFTCAETPTSDITVNVLILN